MCLEEVQGTESNTDSKRSNGASLKLKGKICSAIVRSSMIYGSESETWPMKVKDKQRLERVDGETYVWSHTEGQEVKHMC